MSWEPFSEWYDKIVGEKGHYYHEHVILPNLLRLLDLKKVSKPSIIDIGCGEGVLERYLPKECDYLGVDISPSLIQAAKKKTKENRKFILGDMTKPLPVDNQKFTHAIFILSLQNVEAQDLAIKEAASVLNNKGSLLIVLNHPAFRIPRQSSWGIDQGRKIQYRRIDRYLTPLKIPISMSPGKKKDEMSMSYHYPLAAYGTFLKEAGLHISSIEEWVSDKKSEGYAATMENRARTEFPLFLTLVALKI